MPSVALIVLGNTGGGQQGAGAIDRAAEPGDPVPGIVVSRVSPLPVFAYLEGMEVHFSPDLQAKIDQLVAETGYTPDTLVAGAMAGYVAELAETREMLDSRYDLKGGRLKPISRDELVAHFREKSAAARSPLNDHL